MLLNKELGWGKRYLQSTVVAPVVISFSYLLGGIGFAKILDGFAANTHTGLEWLSVAGIIGVVTSIRRSKHDAKVKDWEGKINILTKAQKSSEDIAGLMAEGFDALVDGYLMQVLNQLGKGQPTCRITLFTYDPQRNAFIVRARYSSNPEYRKKSFRNYPMEGFLQLIWTRKGRFYRCDNKKSFSWHKRNGLPQVSYDSLTLKGRLYSGVRVDIDAIERAVLLLESEDRDLWTEEEINVIFSDQGMNFVTTLVRVGYDHFGVEKLAQEIDDVH